MGKVLQFSVFQSRFVVIMMVIVSNENKIITFRLQCCLDNIDNKIQKKFQFPFLAQGLPHIIYPSMCTHHSLKIYNGEKYLSKSFRYTVPCLHMTQWIPSLLCNTP